VLGIVVIVVLGLGAWVASRALIVKSDLESAQKLVGQLQSHAVELDFDSLGPTSVELEKRSGSAVAHAHDPVWRAAEVIPFLGDNLAAVRIVAESVDSIVQDIALPAIDIVSTIDIGQRDPATGGFDLTPLDRAAGVVSSAQGVIQDSLDKLGRIDQSRTVGPVSTAVAQLDEMLSNATQPLNDASGLLQVASGALGQNGERHYLLAFQNNAEALALGGTTASFTLLSVNNGTIGVAAQAGSRDFPLDIPVDVPVAQSATELYTDSLLGRLNLSTSRPDFPTAATIMEAFWLRDQGEQIDGVISVDPLALALILKATGPITLNSGDVLSSENAVSLLLNEIYFRYDSYTQSDLVDAFFQDAASAILEKVMTGDFDINVMISAVSAGIDQGSILAWSADAAEQAMLDGTRIQGVLPSSNDEDTVIGTYYRDSSVSKIDYYLSTSTHTTSDTCTSPENPTFTTTVDLHSDLTVEEANALPAYVKSGDYGAAKFRTQVFVYGPVGATLTDARVIAEGVGTSVDRTVEDLGRPVATFSVFLAPGETSTVSATFSGAPGAYGPLSVRGTPMINQTTQTVEPMVCG
jgi:hypothetical protein